MERCPNCGAPTRPGAKFCTTCGYRLTVGADDVPTAAPDDAVGHDEVDPGANTWATSIAAPVIAASQSLDADAATESGVATEDGLVPSATDGSPATAAVDADNPPMPRVASEDEAAAVDEREPEVADQVLSSSWPAADAASWSSGWGSPRATAEPPTAAVATDPDGGDRGTSASTPAPWASGTWGSRTEAPAEPVALGPNVDDTVPPAAAVVVESDDAGTGKVLNGDGADVALAPAERAAALVEELRALLPALTAAPELDAEAVAVDLQAALPTDPDAAASDRDLLRATLRAVRDRPRDIDAMLDLAVRADPLLALLDAHDAALDAIDRAVAALVPDRG